MGEYMDNFFNLYEQLMNTEIDNFYIVEEAFFLKFCYITEEKRPNCVIAFMTISNWLGGALRSGVWTYYEVAEPSDIQITLQFLNQTGEQELASIFAYGVHDYQNPKYADCGYPQTWIDESEEIDKWIFKHEDFLYRWEQTLLLDNKELICSL